MSEPIVIKPGEPEPSVLGGLVCQDCGCVGVIEGTCLLCGSDSQEEPFRAGWDESD